MKKKPTKNEEEDQLKAEGPGTQIDGEEVSVIEGSGSFDDLMEALKPLLMGMGNSIPKGKGQDRLGVVGIDKDRMNQFLNSLSDITEQENIAMLTLGLSLTFRGISVNRGATITEFCDHIVKNLRNYIDSPPPGFGSTTSAARNQDDCDCPACKLRRKLMGTRDHIVAGVIKEKSAKE